jgi:hypothetical protein
MADPARRVIGPAMTAVAVLPHALGPSITTGPADSSRKRSSRSIIRGLHGIVDRQRRWPSFCNASRRCFATEKRRAHGAFEVLRPQRLQNGPPAHEPGRAVRRDSAHKPENRHSKGGRQAGRERPGAHLGDGCTRLKSRSSVGRCVRQCYWPGYPSMLSELSAYTANLPGSGHFGGFPDVQNS